MLYKEKICFKKARKIRSTGSIIALIGDKKGNTRLLYFICYTIIYFMLIFYKFHRYVYIDI